MLIIVNTSSVASKEGKRWKTHVNVAGLAMRKKETHSEEKEEEVGNQ